jgi:DNA-binding PadR family transcriptional regulator
VSTLTSTSYAVLGLIAVRPCSTYEIAGQVDRTLNRFWPRTRSKLYEEPKKLVAQGLATATRESVGRRPRTVYAITPAGRRALAAWVASPAEGPVLEFEQLLKVFYCDSGTTDDVRRHLSDLRAWAHERTLANIRVGQAYLEGRGPSQHRAAVNQVVGRFLDDFLQTLDDWALWAGTVVEAWPDSPAEAEQDLAEQRRTVAQARARAARYAR